MPALACIPNMCKVSINLSQGYWGPDPGSVVLTRSNIKLSEKLEEIHMPAQPHPFLENMIQNNMILRKAPAC